MSVPSLAQELLGKVNGVYNGDTILVRRDRQETQVKLRGIESPPENSMSGRKARRFLEALLLGQTVRVQAIEPLQDGSVLGTVLFESRDVAIDLLRAGLVRYQSESYLDRELEEAETLAREAGIGIWAEPMSPTDQDRSVSPSAAAPGKSDEILFEKVKYVDRRSDKRKEVDAQVIFSDWELVTKTENGKQDLIRIPFDLVREISYERSSHPRWETMAAPSILGIFGDRKKHWLTIIWREEGSDNYTVLRLDKDNYQEIIAACESRLGIDVRWIVDYEPPPF
jgi:endonuclease YncB( thermonuclease family)